MKLRYSLFIYFGFFFLVLFSYFLGLEQELGDYLKGHWVVFALIYFFFTFLSFEKEKKYLLSPVNIYIVFFLFYYGLGTIGAIIFLDKLLSASSILLILAGYILGLFGCKLVRYPESVPIKTNYFRKFRMFNLMAIAVFLSVTFSLVWYKKLGVIPIFAKDVEYARTILAQGTYVIRQLMSLAVPAFFLVWVGYKDKRKNLWIYSCFVLISFIMISEGYRSFMLSFWVIVVLLEFRLRGNYLNMKTLILFSAVVLLFIFLFGIYRYRSSDRNTIVEKTDLAIVGQLFVVRPITLEMIVKQFPEKTKFQMGKFYLLGFNFILPGRQTGAGQWLKNDVLKLEFEGGGLNPGIIGEFYLNFGKYGVLFGMIAFGLLLNLSYRYYLSSRNPLMLILSSTIMLYLLISLSPGFATIVMIILWYCIITILYYSYLKLKIYRTHYQGSTGLPVSE